LALTGFRIEIDPDIFPKGERKPPGQWAAGLGVPVSVTLTNVSGNLDDS
jgi:hypothetical protein